MPRSGSLRKGCRDYRTVPLVPLASLAAFTPPRCCSQERSPVIFPHSDTVAEPASQGTPPPDRAEGQAGEECSDPCQQEGRQNAGLELDIFFFFIFYLVVFALSVLCI